MDAILGIDHESWTGGFLHPLVDAGRAIAAGRAGINIMLGRLLQVHVGDLEMNRLVFLVIGIRQKD